MNYFNDFNYKTVTMHRTILIHTFKPPSNETRSSLARRGSLGSKWAGSTPGFSLATSRSDHIAGMPNGNSLISQNRKILILNYIIKLSYFLFVVYLYVLCSLKPYCSGVFLGPVEHIRTLQQTRNKENVIIRKHISHYLILTDEQKKLSLKTCQGKLACHPGKWGGGVWDGHRLS